mgnify:FL=1
MKTNEMIKEVAERATDIIAVEAKKVSMKDVTAILQAYSECVIQNLVENKEEKIPLYGIGSFTAKFVKEKDGVSAINGKSWHKDAENQLKFTIKKSVKTIA